MVDIIRRKNAHVISEDVSAVGKATVGVIKAVENTVSQPIKKIQKQKEKEEKQYLTDVKQNIKTEQTRIANEQKAFDASDKLIAADMAGRLKNDLLRWNLDQRQNNPNYIGTAEHEKRMRDEYARLSDKYGAGLGEAGKSEFKSKTQNAVNDFIGNDVKWAYQRKLKQAEQSAKEMAQTMNENAKLYGASGDVEGFKESNKETRDSLKEYIESVAPDGTRKALLEADVRSIQDFIIGLAESDPYAAKSFMEDKEFFKYMISDDVLQNINDMKRESAMGNLNDKLTLINFDLARGVDSDKKKKLEKLKKQTEKELKEVKDKDYTEDSISEIKDQVEKSVKKTIDYNINLREAEEEKARNQQRIENSLAFMDNPILYRANLQRTFGENFAGNVSDETDEKLGINKKLDEKAKEIYSLSDKVGDGKVDPITLQLIVRQVASITADDKTGIVDDNIMKAYDGEIALRKAGANPEQLQTYHGLVQMAMTDTNFKQSVAALANKPDFDTMFLNKNARYTGLRSLFRTAKDDDTDYVEDLGRQAYFGAMNLMYQGRPEEALSYYDRKVADAYDFIKRDIIDVDYVKKQLAKNGSAMVELNGRMTKITGRLPNGEYIVESTGEKVNGNF